ncbi:IclR family transcriptional regulator [Heyndrickxia acidicola]|uniref:IclR family transcriptional regulator n=1 Tax=Heyndrickxia acidicola TaxID=209389 RepID=A0ABU6MND5_9BACI|nr:IclR family transcriptional regulator [Heyndrickxia acidicola]MED1204555.1 IclR family transcriptional regulator [Heyndrickxia acidicola]
MQAVDRALTLLKLVADNNAPILIGDLVNKSNMNRTTVWRLLATLEQHDFIERDPLTKGYCIGYAASRLGAGTDQYAPLVRRARPSMERLREETGESVLLSVPKHFGTLTIDQIDSPHSVRLIDYVNVLLPLHCTSNGKLLLSRLSNDELHTLFQQQPLEKMTQFTITDHEQLLKEVELVHKNGFGTSLGELDESENGISAPILDKQKNLIAFLSLCGPNFRFTKDRVLASAPLIISEAQRISQNL